MLKHRPQNILSIHRFKYPWLASGDDAAGRRDATRGPLAEKPASPLLPPE